MRLQPRLVGFWQPAGGERDAELGVELVHGAVGLDPRIGLRDAAHVAEVRLAPVAEAGVDACQIYRHSLPVSYTTVPMKRVLLAAVLAALFAGCGSKAAVPTGGRVTVTVSQDYGETRLAPTRGQTAADADTVLDVLSRSQFEVRASGAAVDEIDGLSGGQENGKPVDVVLVRERDRDARRRRRPQALQGRPHLVRPPRRRART